MPLHSTGCHQLNSYIMVLMLCLWLDYLTLIWIQDTFTTDVGKTINAANILHLHYVRIQLRERKLVYFKIPFPAPGFEPTTFKLKFSCHHLHLSEPIPCIPITATTTSGDLAEVTKTTTVVARNFTFSVLSLECNYTCFTYSPELPGQLLIHWSLQGDGCINKNDKLAYLPLFFN